MDDVFELSKFDEYKEDHPGQGTDAEGRYL